MLLMPAAQRPLPIYLSAGAVFAAMMARNFVLPLRVHEVGGSRVEVGLLFTVFTITAAALSLPAGFLADRLGKRALVSFSALAGGISQLGVAAASEVSPMYAWQALAGLSGGAAQAGLYAALAEVVPAARLGRAMGWLTLAMQMGFLTGPAAAGAALNFLDLQQTLAASSGLYALALALAVTGIPGGRRRQGSWDLLGPLREMAFTRGFWAAVVALFAATLIWGTQQAYLPLFATEQLRLPRSVVGYMVALQAVANGLARVPGGRLVDRTVRKGPIVIVGVAGYALAVGLLPHTAGFWSATALLALAVPLMATAYIALGVAFNDMASPKARGVAMGLYGTVLYVGLGLGPAVFGPLMERSGYTYGFTACAVTGLVLTALVVLLRLLPVRESGRATATPGRPTLSADRPSPRDGGCAPPAGGGWRRGWLGPRRRED